MYYVFCYGLGGRSQTKNVSSHQLNDLGLVGGLRIWRSCVAHACVGGFGGSACRMVG
jgi:hypothetical protein